MRLAILNGGIVDNVVISDLDFAEKMGWHYVELADGVQCAPGWLYDGETFTAPVIIEVDAIEKPTEIDASKTL